MLVKRGSVYLANFNPSKGTEPGKIRRCLVLQNDLLNEAGHPSTTVLPLTTLLLDDAAPLRYRLGARDDLHADSDVMVDQTRTIDNRRFTDEVLTSLTEQEMADIESYWRIVVGLD
ncbi:MAG: hypothetical protein BMS9Abin32_143 [Gammaproteobacteria bacterium]|nr:MAG: hypothetical protein BMS9Abin32_143 [Gammaproteobacteria bacterium]